MRASWMEKVFADDGLSCSASTDWRSRGESPFKPTSITIINTAGTRGGSSLPALVSDSSANLYIAKNGDITIVSSGFCSTIFDDENKKVAQDTIVIALENDNEGESYPQTQIDSCTSVCVAISKHLSINNSHINAGFRYVSNNNNPRGWNHEDFLHIFSQQSPSSEDSEHLKLFKGNYEWILNQNSDSFPDANDIFTPQAPHPDYGQGLKLPGGLDLYAHGNWLLHNIYPILLPAATVHALIEFTRLKGAAVAANMHKLNSLSFQSSMEKLQQYYPKILDDTWNLMYNFISYDFFTKAPAQVHTAMLSFFFERGFRNTRTRHLIRLLNSEEWLEIAVYLNSLKGDTAFINRRRAEAALILSSNMPLSGEVGIGTGSQEDRKLVLDRLNELGYDDQDPDANIRRFLQVAHSTLDPIPDSIIPGSLSHCYLLSSNCPSLNPILSQGPGYKMTGQIKIVDSVQKLISNLGKEYQRVVRRHEINRITGDTTPLPPETFTCTQTGEPYVIEISIPGIRGPDEIASSLSDPLCSRENLEFLIRTIKNFSPEITQEALLIDDDLFEAEGLSIVEGGSDDKLILLATPAGKPCLRDLEFESQMNPALSAALMGDMRRNSSSEPAVAPQDEAAKFDFYMNIINSRLDQTVPEPPAGVIEMLGISGWLDGQRVPDTKDGYNDTIIQLWVENGVKRVKEYKGSTSPGKYSKFYNPKGDAHLINDARYKFHVGLHTGYTALRQAEAVSVWRDPHKDGVRRDDSLVETGWYGINIHAAGSGTKVGNWSAGCQVIWGGKTGAPWLDFINRITDTNIHANQNEIYYTLVHGTDITGPPQAPPPAITMPPFNTDADNRTTTLSGESSSQELTDSMTELWEEVHELLEVNPNPKMRAALTCLAYDIGMDNLARSTLLQRLNLPDYLGASESFEHWNNYNNTDCADIPARRENQRLMFVDDGMPGYSANFNNEVNWLGPWNEMVSRCFTINDVFHMEEDRRRDSTLDATKKAKIMEMGAALDEVRLRGWSFKVVSWYRDTATHTRLGSPSGETDHTEGRAVTIMLRSGEDLGDFQTWLSQNWTGSTRTNGGRIFTLSIQ